MRLAKADAPAPPKGAMQPLVDGLLAARPELRGVALVDSAGLPLASGGEEAGTARQAGAAADLGALEGELMLVEGEHGCLLLHRWSESITAVLLLRDAHNLGGVLAEARRCAGLLGR